MIKTKFPLYGWAGVILVITSWIVNWFFDGLRTHLAFFPLWLGYCLTTNALTHIRKGNSLLSRSIKSYILLFFISIPCWWLFEFFNQFTKNWYYDGSQYFTPLEFFLLASLSFSTVMPAIFSTAELMSTFKWTKKFNGRKFYPDKILLRIFFIPGGIISFLVILIPVYFYPFIWLSLYLVTESLNVWLGNNSLLEDTASGNWSIVISLAAGSLICGFFWEMWNYYSYPKWTYYLPGVNFLHIFEMPLLGFIGYIPFSFTIYALYNMFTGKKKEYNILFC